jgi:hypothetical protein
MVQTATALHEWSAVRISASIADLENGQTEAFALVFAFAARFLPATFLARWRAAMVLPLDDVAALRGIARDAFFFLFSTLRAERAPRAAGIEVSSLTLLMVST